MQFVLIDDVEQHNETLAVKVLSLCEKNGWDGQISLKTTKAQEVADYVADAKEATVYFMDIELESNATSLPLHTVIEKNPVESYIVYVSAHAQYAMECLHTHAFDFLLKPLCDKQLEECMKAIMKAHVKKEERHYLQVHTGSRTVMVNPDNILYFSRDRMAIRLHAQDGSTLVWRESFDHLLTRLNARYFFLCHRSYVINLRHIRTIDWEMEQLTLRDGTELPISRRRSAALKVALKQLEEVA